MRFLHTADWHIGRRLHGFDLTAEQAHAFKTIERIAKEEAVDGIIIAGDLYDRSLPGEAAVQQLNQMLKQLNLVDDFPIYAISGNHDSAVRLSTGSDWFKSTNMFIHTKVAQALNPVELPGVQLFLLPYFEPFAVREFLGDDGIQTVAQAFSALVAQMQTAFDPAKRHVLVSHFFTAGSATTDSETKLTVGGLAAVPAELLAPFDYVALGHLHGKDAIRMPNVQYSGSPVKFSLSEANQQKGVFIVDTDDVEHRQFIPIEPLHDVVQLTDTFAHLNSPDVYEMVEGDYVGVTITDTVQIPNLMARLRKVYPRLIELKRTHGFQMPLNQLDGNRESLQKQDPIELLKRFYQTAVNDSMTETQLKWAQAALKQANGGQQE